MESKTKKSLRVQEEAGAAPRSGSSVFAWGHGAGAIIRSIGYALNPTKWKFVEKVRGRRSVESLPLETKLEAVDKKPERIKLPAPFVKRLEDVKVPGEDQAADPEVAEDGDDDNFSDGSSVRSVLPIPPDYDDDEFERASLSSDILPFSTIDDDMLYAQQRMIPELFKTMTLAYSSESLTSSAFEWEYEIANNSALQAEMRLQERQSSWEKDHGEETLTSDLHNGSQEDGSSTSGAYSISASDEAGQDSEGNGVVNDANEASTNSSIPGPSPPKAYPNVKWAPLSTTVEQDPNDEFADWDPRIIVFKSTRNIKCFDAETTLQGVPHFKGAICPYSNSKDSCYKGDRCPCEHHIDRKKLSANPKLAVPYEPHRITHLDMLPLKIEGQQGACFYAKVTCVNSINDLYVVPIKGVYCECKKFDKDYIKRLSNGAHTLESMTSELNFYFSRHSAKYSSSYAFLELAAVRIVYNDELGYYRVAILEDLPIESDEFPDVLCYFLDLGHTTFLNLSILQILPRAFSYVPPLAYRCSLSSVTSAQMCGDGPAEEYLREAVKDREVLVKVQRKCVLGDVTAVNYTEQIPYSVELYSRDTSGRYTPLSDMLMEKGVVIRRGEPSLDEATGFDEPEDDDQEGGCYHDESLEFLQN